MRWDEWRNRPVQGLWYADYCDNSAGEGGARREFSLHSAARSVHCDENWGIAISRVCRTSLSYSGVRAAARGARPIRWSRAPLAQRGGMNKLASGGRSSERAYSDGSIPT